MPLNSAVASSPYDVLALSPESAPVASEARRGLSATAKSLPPWLFYDKGGSELFEQITQLPEYYPTRTERSLFLAHADEIFDCLAESDSSDGASSNRADGSNRDSSNRASSDGASSNHASSTLTIAELGAGTATKTGVLLRALTQRQPEVLYQPIDISPSALDEACSLEQTLPGVRVVPQTANYITDGFWLDRAEGARVLALYIGSSVGNFSPAEARGVLRNLRTRLADGDALLLGTDLAPGRSKPVSTLIAAYNDAAGVTAAFNRNMLHRLNAELGADFDLSAFQHRAIWNAEASRIEMHLRSTRAQTVHLPAHRVSPGGSTLPEMTIRFTPGETIHTENSYKFNSESIAALLRDSGFAPLRTFTDPDCLFAVTLARAA